MELSIYLLLLILLAPVEPRREIHPVIVIGAGVSGLRASQMLNQQRISHMVIESTHAIGGRVTSMDFAGLQVDKGASFIHNATDFNPLGKLVRGLKWPWANGTCSYKVMYYEGERQASIPTSIISLARNMYFQMSKDILNKYDENERVSVKQAFQAQIIKKKYRSQPTLIKILVRWMFDILANIDGTSSSNESALNAEYNETKPDLFPLPAFHKLLPSIFPSVLPIRFGQTVTSIDYHGPVIKIKTDKGEHLAKRVICSIPLGVLKAGKVEFIPALPPGHQEAIKQIGFGVENKLFVRFEKPFWNTGDRWLSFVSEGRVNRYPSAFVAPYPHVHILIFFISGKYSLEMSEWTDAKLEKDLHDFLARYKKEGAIKILQVRQTRWHQDPNTLGTYSFYSLGTKSSHFGELAVPVNDKLWLTGEHTIKELNSFVHGAYLAGERATREVLASLKKDAKRQM